MKNAMSIDVEDYFQVSAFAPHIRREDWDTLPCRVERNVDVILGLLDAADARATFFTLGWIAERYPQLVRRIVDNGHELASHGYGHQRASDLTPAEFRADIVRAKRILEDLGGVAVRGYRAPSFSINQANGGQSKNWKRGYVYSSSIYPGATITTACPTRRAFRTTRIARAASSNCPPTHPAAAGRNLPAAGGGWFRCCPTRCRAGCCAASIGRIGRRMFYFHPWELDPGQPRSRGCRPGRASATTSTCSACRTGLAGC